MHSSFKKFLKTTLSTTIFYLKSMLLFLTLFTKLMPLRSSFSAKLVTCCILLIDVYIF